MSKYTMSRVLAYCTLFAIVRSAPIYRELSDNADCEPNDGSVFRDPSEVLGLRFTRFAMTDLCETKALISPAANPKSIRHTARGSRLCGDVCEQFRDALGRDRCGPPVKATTLEAYCRLNGGDRPVVGLEEMGSTCECIYRVQSGKNAVEVAEYSFEVNGVGDLRVSVADTGSMHFVTPGPTAAGPCG